MSTRVAIVEDHTEFRESIGYMLSSTEGFTCVGKYGSVEESFQCKKHPDVILLDIDLPGMSGIEGIPGIRKRHPNAKIIMLTVFDDDANIFEAILRGADGYILKKTSPVRLLQAIEDAAAGGSPMTPAIAKQALQILRERVPHRTEEHNLSERETEILSCLVKGMSNDEISSSLFISRATVRNHITHIYEKLHVHSKAQAVVKAMKEGIT